MSVIYRGPTRGYTLTDDDVLWLARGFVGEAGEGAGDCSRNEAAWLFWTWINRLLLMPDAKWKSWSLATMVKNHSQALSTAWDDPSDEKCVQYPSRCTPAAIARRARIRSKTQKQLEAAGVWQFAVDAQEGRLGRPWGASHVYDFEACSQTDKGVNVGGNCFYRYDELPAWQKPLVARGEKVRKDPTAGTIAGWATGAAATVLLGYAGWRLWESRRRRR